MTLWNLAEFAGGIGLFLLGMRLMTDGLRVAAGEALRDLLSSWTSKPLRGVFAGVAITAMVQSSSAVIFATIGFVNAGLLSLAQAVGVIYGSNLGTTVTSWLVAVVGFKLDVKVLAMPAIALGMLLRATGGTTRRGALGEAVAGFGVFFLGIDVLQGTFADIGQTVDLAGLGGGGWLGLVPFLLIGVLLTVAMQSSSAALAVTLTAAAGGVIELPAAAAVVIGANVGTTSTAAFAVIGATPNAKRAASAHVLFNLVTGAVTFLALPLLLHLVVGFTVLLGAQDSPAIALAIFHTLSKTIGVLLLLPLTPRLVDALQRRFRSAEEDLGRPRHLDGNVLATPVLALNALKLELDNIGGIARRMTKQVLSAEAHPNGQALHADKQALDRLTLAVADFTKKAQRPDLPEELADAFPAALRVSQYFADMAERSLEVAELQRRLAPVADPALAAHLAAFKQGLVKTLEQADATNEAYDAERAEQSFRDIQADYQRIKHELLRATTEARLPVGQMAARLDELSALRRSLDQAVKAMRYLGTIDAAASRHYESAGLS